MPFYHVAQTTEISPGHRRIVPVGRFGVGVFNVNGEFRALRNYCPHVGAPVCLGAISGVASASIPYQIVWSREGEVLRCPWHGWEFDISSGESLTRPVRRIKRYPVKVADGHVYIKISEDEAREAANVDSDHPATTGQGVRF